ncbi:MAG: cation transporter [Saprospiraceae bacterium]|nr:cation transporter [Saprospiraceae bacterium]
MSHTNRSSVRLQWLALSIGLLLMAGKFYAWWTTNSNAILTDALESIINVVAGGFALYSLLLAFKPRDLNHPYGHGKIEFLSAGFEGGLIFLAGISIIGKSCYNLLYPQQLGSLDLGMLVTALAGGVNFVLGWVLERRGKQFGSLILIADGRHLKSDAYSSAGLLVGLFLLRLTGIQWIDNATALLFGALILYTGYRLLRTSVAGIMDEADYQLVKSITQHLDQHRSANWVDLHNFRVIKYGSALHIDCHLTVPWYLEVKEAHNETKSMEKQVAHSCSTPVEVFVHTDPCAPPSSCTVCLKTDCPVRQADFIRRVSWSLENVLSNDKHSVGRL